MNLSKYVSERDLIAMITAALIAHAIFGKSDISLAYDFRTGALPYGIAWNLINPYYWTQLPYRTIVTLIQAPIIILQLWLTKKRAFSFRGKNVSVQLNKWMVYLNIFTTIWYRLMINYQDVSNIEFMPFATMTPLFALSFLVQRYPFWTLIPNLNDPHYQCVIGNCVRFTVDRVAQTLQPSFASHITLVLWLVLPLYAWYKKSHNSEWDDTRFWKISTFLMVAVMIEGIVTFMLVGCCYGATDFPQT